jgi:hypothetical protein
MRSASMSLRAGNANSTLLECNGAGNPFRTGDAAFGVDGNDDDTVLLLRTEAGNRDW